MTENPSAHGGPGQARPGDDYYGDHYDKQDDHPQEPGGYPNQPGYDQGGYRGGGYGQPGGYDDYGRGAPARRDEARYGRPDQGPSYPDQGGGYDQRGGYDQGYQGGPGYGRQDYAQPDNPRYADVGQGPVHGAPDGGYAPPPGRDYDYGQPAPGGYGGYDQGGYDRYYQGGYDQGGYDQGGYSSSGTAVTLQLDDGSGRTYQLREGANIVGRGQDAQFRLPDTGVSRRHLEIRWDGQVALLSDLNSTNGTTVNNAPVQEWQLADGDVIRLGHSEVVVHIH
jgi:hypothetical protein